MLRIIGGILNATVMLVAEGDIFYQVKLYWSGNGTVPENGTQMIFPYEATATATSEEIAWKWENWNRGILYDDELPPPDEIVAMVEISFADYKAGRGYTP